MCGLFCNDKQKTLADELVQRILIIRCTRKHSFDFICFCVAGVGPSGARTDSAAETVVQHFFLFSLYRIGTLVFNNLFLPFS